MQRARQENDKEIRRQQILTAANDLLKAGKTSLPAVSEIAAAANLAKGSVYNYFPTKEEVYFTLVSDGFDRWIDALKKSLKQSDMTIEKAVDGYTEFCINNHKFVHLTSIAPTILEQNISLEMATKFKSKVAHEIMAIAEQVTELFPKLNLTETLQLYLSSYAATIGLWQLSNPSEVIIEATSHNDTSFLRPDFNSLLKPTLINLWQGTLSQKE